MQKQFEDNISKQMIDMLENWEVPTERILGWFKNKPIEEGTGAWFLKLLSQEVLYSYYEMLYLGEGSTSKDITDISKAHPLRVVPLYRYLSKKGDTYIYVRGEKFTNEEMEVVILTSGKVSVEDIINYTGLGKDNVIDVLNRLEKRHLIVYTI